MEKYIESAYDFFKIAQKIKEERGHVSQVEFYRGHSNKMWKLLPSIDRENSLLNFEEKLINEFMRRRPEEFSEDEGMFNILAKMQHYGLHTRLLDITENPAVALYFACSSEYEHDGEIFIFQRSLDEVEDNEVANIILNFYIRFEDENGRYNLDDYYKYALSKYNKRNVEKALYYLINGYSCFARPRLIAERIKRQLGAFMIIANEVCPKVNCKNEQCKRRIRNECKNNEIPINMDERIKITSVKHIFNYYTKAHIINEQNGCRYIIKSDKKKEILSQLKTIGITKSFLFPEIENEGIDIIAEYKDRIYGTN